MGSSRGTTEDKRATMLVNIIFLILLPAIYCSPTGGRNLSRFQVAVQHCCSSKTSKTPHRCFELNEFSGVNFVASPCRFLKTLEKTLSPASDLMTLSDVRRADQIVKKSAAPETKKKVVSKFQNAVQNCCSNKNSNTAYRCFEINGVQGVNFVEKPCMFLNTIKNMLEEAAAAK